MGVAWHMAWGVWIILGLRRAFQNSSWDRKWWNLLSRERSRALTSFLSRWALRENREGKGAWGNRWWPEGRRGQRRVWEKSQYCPSHTPPPSHLPHFLILLELGVSQLVYFYSQSPVGKTCCIELQFLVNSFPNLWCYRQCRWKKESVNVFYTLLEFKHHMDSAILLLYPTSTLNSQVEKRGRKGWIIRYLGVLCHLLIYLFFCHTTHVES